MHYKTLLKILISFLFLLYVLFKVDLPLLFQTLLSVKLAFYLASFLVVILNIFILAEKYKIVMKPSGIYQSFLNLVKIDFICHFYSMFLSTAIGQSVIRWHYSTKNQKGRLNFIAAIIFERSTFFFALFFAVLLSFIILSGSNVKIVVGYLYPLIIAGLIVILFFYLFLNYSPLYHLINRLLPNRSKTIDNRLINNVYDCMQSFSAYHKKGNLLVTALCLAFMWHFLFILRVYLLALSLQVPLSFIHLAWMASLVLLIQVVPISLNGIGIRETAYAFLFKLLDLPPEPGVIVGILLFSQMFLISAVGGVLHLFSKD